MTHKNWEGRYQSRTLLRRHRLPRNGTRKRQHASMVGSSSGWLLPLAPCQATISNNNNADGIGTTRRREAKDHISTSCLYLSGGSLWRIDVLLNGRFTSCEASVRGQTDQRDVLLPIVPIPTSWRTTASYRQRLFRQPTVRKKKKQQQQQKQRQRQSMPHSLPAVASCPPRAIYTYSNKRRRRRNRQRARRRPAGNS
jgi:hypothetical protein